VDTNSSRSTPLLFTPLELRGKRLRNRIVIAPMCQYSAHEGVPTDWHLVHLGRFAVGGAGIVITEATAVEKRGRITHGDIGLWSDEHIGPLARLAHFLKQNGAAACVQLGHGGRKASMQRPWYGNGPLDEADIARGDLPWDIVAPSAVPVDEGWLVPRALETSEIPEVVEAFAAAARRALEAGFDFAEIHGAHGYLIQSFLSPIANHRNDAYGGNLAGRMRLALEVTEAVRAVWPEDRPLFFRISSVDGVEGGWTMDETLVLVRELKALGVDVVDCSSGGILGAATAGKVKRKAGFQVHYAEQVRREAGVMTQAVGLITHPVQAEDILANGQADLIAIGREALADPQWPLHAATALGCDPGMEAWPQQYGWWLVRRERSSELYVPETTA
jgi:2,4-dienoyl-CoA reductase-like NADH-dependent reductase (Old Yellow Enzyme family)